MTTQSNRSRYDAKRVPKDLVDYSREIALLGSMKAMGAIDDEGYEKILRAVMKDYGVKADSPLNPLIKKEKQGPWNEA